MQFFGKAARMVRKRIQAPTHSQPGTEYEMRQMLSQERVTDCKTIKVNSRTGFDRLPMEIRKRIFRIVLSDPQLWGPVPVSQTSRVALREPELMRVCKSFRADVGRLYYGRNSFIFYVEAWEGAMAAVVRKIQYMLTCTDAESLLDRLTIIVHPNWLERDTLLPLLELICASGAADRKGKVRLSAYNNKLLINRRRHRGDVSSQDYLNYAVQLALRARYEGWYGKRLSLEYDDLLAQMRPLEFKRASKRLRGTKEGLIASKHMTRDCDLRTTIRCPPLRRGDLL